MWGQTPLDPCKFRLSRGPRLSEKLPDIKEFEPQRMCKKTKPNFARRSDRVRFKSATVYLGPKNDIRANLAGVSKAYFLDPKRLPCRIMAHFGINPADVRVWTGN